MKPKMVWICALVLTVASSTGAWGQNQEDKDGNELFAEVATRVPEFAGLYVGQDQETYMVNVTSSRPGLVEDLRAALIAVMGELRPGGFEKITLVEGATYSWLQLMEWYRPLRNSVHQLEGVTLSSIGSKESRIQIGVVDPERHAAAVEAELDRLDIPREAVIIRQMGPFTTTSASTSRDPGSRVWWLAGAGAVMFGALSSWLIYRRRAPKRAPA
jgi:hypothetical protein